MLYKNHPDPLHYFISIYHEKISLDFSFDNPYFSKKISSGGEMKMLTRAEELVLLTVLKLKEDAYCVPIFNHLQKISNKKWTLGNIYSPLYRLEQIGLLESRMGDPTSERGGKSKRYFKVTPEGLKALKTIKKLHDTSWDGVTDLVFE